MMIYTVTLNPAIDYIVEIDDFKEGKVNRMKNEQFFYGGKGINVSCVLKELGIESCCLGFVAGFTGKELVSGLNKRGIQNDFIQVEGLTRINVKVRSNEETELNGNGPLITQNDLEKLLNKIEKLKEEDMLVLSGSIPKGISQDIYVQIIERIKDKGVKVIVDTTKEALLQTLKYHPFLIKPNHHELAELFGVEINSIEEMWCYTSKLQKLGALNVCVSMAKKGAILLDEDGNQHRCGICEGKLVNSIGAGDSMVAGFIAGYQSKMNYSKMLRFASICGCATAFSSHLATLEKIRETEEKFTQEQSNQ